MKRASPFIAVTMAAVMLAPAARAQTPAPAPVAVPSTVSPDFSPAGIEACAVNPAGGPPGTYRTLRCVIDRGRNLCSWFAPEPGTAISSFLNVDPQQGADLVITFAPNETVHAHADQDGKITSSAITQNGAAAPAGTALPPPVADYVREMIAAARVACGIPMSDRLHRHAQGTRSHRAVRRTAEMR